MEECVSFLVTWNDGMSTDALTSCVRVLLSKAKVQRRNTRTRATTFKPGL